jgi:hypothetical protein
MKPKYNETIWKVLAEIKDLSKELPQGKRNQISNRCDKISSTIKKMKVMNTSENKQTQRQIADRYIAKNAIFEAMMNGRRISFLDSAEFEVSEMHTQMHCIRQDIADKNLPVVLKDEWMEFGKHGKKCKRYWLEARS